MVQPLTVMLFSLQTFASAIPTSLIPTTLKRDHPTSICPTDIVNTPFQYPHLIVPTSPTSPNTAFGNSFTAYITPTNSTLFNFDIPTSYTGACSLVFLFPYASDSDPGTYTYSGMEQVTYQNGGLDFALLGGIANAGTTWATTPDVRAAYGKVGIIPGNRYTITTFPCQSGKTVTYKVSSVNGTVLEYFQDYGPQALGLYIVPCA